jgi:exopolyphosphatase/guanosine-5'-triphosphate,3'-diphosphate pyrophosphatase
MLSWGAQLHEIGLALSFASHQKHGAYIVENSEMAGFSRQEKARLALLIRAHRRKFATVPFAEHTTPPWDVRLPRLAILLRIAVRLNRMRSRAPLPQFQLERIEDGLAITLPETWLAKHPLTRADLEDEAQVLGAAGVVLEVRVSGGRRDGA